MSEDKTPSTNSNTTTVAVIQSIANIATTVVETFGWAGALFISSFSFVIAYATTEQKQRIIDLYVLGEGISKLWAVLILSGLFVITAIAQHRSYTKKLKVVTDELERVGKEKSELQEAKLKKTLQHADSKTGGKLK